MKKKFVEFESIERTDFLIDDDREMAWIAEFDARPFNRFFIFIDVNVHDIWGARLFRAFQKHGKDIFVFKVEPNEKSKSLSFYPEVVSFLENHIATRYDLVFAVGGGIVIDLVSFTVSTYMRGLPLYAVPTTLIGQVDATTAGKTCLNTAACKNLLGTFYYPRVVYNNTCFLETNTERYLRQGFSEVFKYGLLASERLIGMLLDYVEWRKPKALKKLIDLTIDARVAIRKKDALASNLGHTFGHAIEKLTDCAVLHGDAIAVGTVMALSFAQQEGLLRSGVKEKVLEMMKRIGLNIYFDASFDVEKMIGFMRKDKKSSSDKLNFVLLEDVGKPYAKGGSLFYGADSATIRKFLFEFIDDYAYKVDNLSEFLKRDKICYDKENV